jgi:hypothetical protein
MTPQEAADLLDLIVARAPSLRQAGIRSVNLGGASFTLAPAELEADLGDVDDEPGPADALHDPWTFGVPAAGAPTVLPVRKREL